MYKLIACDLDETLYGNDRTIPARNVEAIKRASELGVKFIPATGRGYNSVRETLVDLGLLDKEGEYVISYNGGAITENKGNRLLHFQGLPFEEAEELYRRGLNYDVCIHVYTREMVYAYNITQEEIARLSKRMQVTEVFDRDLQFLAGQDIAKVLYENRDFDYLKKIEEELKDITGNMDVSFSSNRYIEFNSKGVTKGAGLRFVAEMLGIKREETIAIGDNFNDLSMIQEAGLGVGVQNTIQGMRQYCDYITEANNDEGGVGEVIEKFILNPADNR
ncbi:MAG TPA: Cof-type HAD-IIB family hydrolase [Candidatus Lachnoclostridium stercoripullorum]|uniref:Cof-type HAD-IIB family hydrolase n=1 Tax=Candidatus Lachnoclostridium stercoripullorum TaxID=2838635 RepID=A0A9D1W4J8_9FIRM|nr:Cof-type HAD-IIB family hydrolase [Candidatus Lachnoclostridium stercoripullorum]